MNNAKKSLVPHRRFKEFQNAGAWEQRKLGDVVERFDNLRIPVTSSKRKRGITPYYGANGIQDYVQGYTHDGEFVLVAEDGANDLQNYPIHYVNGKVWVNNHAHVLQGKKDIADNLFLVNAIKRIKFETYLVGGSRAKLNADVMMKLPIKMPKLNEQQKLGKYFSRIDTLIALHQRKLNKLKKLKSAYLTEMFPDEGEHKPKRRFAGFTDDWEQRKLGELTKFINGRAYSQDELLSDGKYKVLRVGNFYTNDAWYYSNMELNNKYYANNGDLLYTWSATFGPHIWDGGRVIYHYHIWKLDLTQQLNKLFAVQLLIRDRNILESNTNGSTMAHITKKGMEEKIVSVPTNLKEQEAIGRFLTKLDDIITLHQRKIDKLQKLKNAYLNEMFV